MLPLVALLLATCGAVAAAAAEPAVRVLSAPDCVDAANIVAELAQVPRNATYLRVRHVGDPGTAELAGEVANVVTWDVGQFTGLALPPSAYGSAQRGWRDAGPPVPSSAFQLACRAAGFYLDARSFAHAHPVPLGGPNVSIAREPDPPPAPFRSPADALTLEATVRVPFVHADAPPAIHGTAQLSLMYYVRDTTTGTSFAHLVLVFDNRVPGAGHAGVEAVSADAYSAFVSSPLAPTGADGLPTAYAEPDEASAHTAFVAPWREPRLFRVHVPYARFRAMLARLIRESLPAISPRPEDYVVTLFGVLGEIVPGTGDGHEVALGASVADLALAVTQRAPPPTHVAPVPVVEYVHAGAERYFVTARTEEIAALDAGAAPGWTRTGSAFLAWPDRVVGAEPVCRVWQPDAPVGRHFYSASPRECREAAQAASGAIEDPAAMYVLLPDAAGACAEGTQPLHRLWDARGAAGHRYVVDRALRAALRAAGWVAEGYGEDGVAMCVPRAR